MTEPYSKPFGTPNHQQTTSVNTSDSIEAILERANQKLKEEITPIDSLTHRQAILEQRLRLIDEALKKFSAQQLRLGIAEVPKDDLQKLLTAANVQYNFHDSEEELRKRVTAFLSSL